MMRKKIKVFFSKFVLYLNLFLLILLIISCAKPVYTTYYEKENFTKFRTHPVIFKIRDHDFSMVASTRCDGLNFCSYDDIQLKLTHEDRFAFLKGKDFFIETDNKTIDLNHRDYKFSYESRKVAKDGTTGVATETWLIYLNVEDFESIALAKNCIFKIGDDQKIIEYSLRENLRILIDNKKILTFMDKEQKRTYGKSSNSPISEVKRRKKFIEKASTEAEEETWKLIKNSNDPEDLIYFLEKYPNSPFSITAKLKLKQLERINNK